MGAKHGPLVERFWAKVRKDADCWVWTAGCDTSGYGQIQGETRRLYRAHRLSYEWHYGPIPPGLMVLHACDNRRCVNPAHLSLGTYVDNARDMVSKGRSAKGDDSSARKYPELRRRGVDHPKVKLTEAQVYEVRALNAAGWSQRRLAQHYGVGKNTIQSILEGKTWAHLS